MWKWANKEESGAGVGYYWLLERFRSDYTIGLNNATFSKEVKLYNSQKIWYRYATNFLVMCFQCSPPRDFASFQNELQKSYGNLTLTLPAKFRETFSEIFISYFAKFSNYFREISRNEIYENFAKFREISWKWSYKTVQKLSLSTF